MLHPRWWDNTTFSLPLVARDDEQDIKSNLTEHAGAVAGGGTGCNVGDGSRGGKKRKKKRVGSNPTRFYIRPDEKGQASAFWDAMPTSFSKAA